MKSLSGRLRLRPYLSVFQMRFRVETQYRAAALGGVVTQGFFALILIALYRALYAAAPQAESLAHTVTYVWIQQMAFRLLFSADTELAETVRTGGMAYELCRPLSPYGFYFARAMAQKMVGCALRAVPILLVMLLLPDGWRMAPPAGVWQLGAFFASLLAGLVCVCALDNIAMAFTIRSLDNRGITNALNLLMVTLSGNLIPLTLFPDAWQPVLRYSPYAQLLDAPIRIYNGLCAPGEALERMAVQGLWALALVALGAALWRKNQKRMVLQGG